jgi:hypothetical protein
MGDMRTNRIGYLARTASVKTPAETPQLLPV